MKHLFILLVLLTCFKGLLAQKKGKERIDSLLWELTKAKEDTNKVKLLTNIFLAYRRTDYNKAISYAEQSEALAGKLNAKALESNSLYFHGNIHLDHSEFSQALACYAKSLQIAKELNQKEIMAPVLNNMAIIYLNFGDLPKGIETNLNALQLFEQFGDKQGMANCLINIATVYQDMGDYTQSNDYIQRAYKIYTEIGRKSGIAVSLNNMGTNYSRKKEFDKALNAFRNALEIYKELNDAGGMDLAFINLAETNNDLAEYDKALENAFKALEVASSNDISESVGYDYNVIAGIYHKMATDPKVTKANTKRFLGRNTTLKLAGSYVDSATAIFLDLGMLKDYANALELSAQIASAEGNYQEAFQKQVLFKSINDSIFNLEKDRKITQSAMQYAFDKKEAEIKAEQEKSNIRQRNIRNSIIVGLLGSLLFLLVVYRQRNNIAKEKLRSEELLLNILPSEVADELKEKGSAKAKQFNEVTVMFTDFKGFTQISEKLLPDELVAEIHHCFKAFDEIITKYHIEKIKTIGDAYMCAGGLPVANETHATDLVNAALEIQQFMLKHFQYRKSKNQETFEIRIGIHTGPVVAGIVGVKKFAYDIWGDTVNTASRMESSGEAGKINISGTTYQLVKDKFAFTQRGKIQAKGKGELDMYFVEGRI